MAKAKKTVAKKPEAAKTETPEERHPGDYSNRIAILEAAARAGFPKQELADLSKHLDSLKSEDLSLLYEQVRRGDFSGIE